MNRSGKSDASSTTNTNPKASRPRSSEDFDWLEGGGEMGARMRAFDWAASPLGAVSQWPQSLKTAVRIVLTARQPMFVWWGDGLINLYNDSYKTILGRKHPAALGQLASTTWREIWDQVGPRAERAMRTNTGTFDEDLLVVTKRHGYREEAYFTFSYSPIPDDDGRTGGILGTLTEDTERIVGERQLSLLRELARGGADAGTVDQACALMAGGLGKNPRDLPFAMIYQIDAAARRAILTACAGIERGHPAAPDEVALDGPSLWPFRKVLETQRTCLVSNLGPSYGSLPTGAWSRAPHQAIAAPIASAGDAAVLVAGLSPFRLFNEHYRGFIDLVSGRLAASLSRARLVEREQTTRREAESLREAAEMANRAKDEFLAMLGHELRNPLAPILTALQLMRLRGTENAERERLVIERQVTHLTRLVDDLLDVSRIARGKVDLKHEQMEIADVVAQAIEMAGPLIEHRLHVLDVSVPREGLAVDGDLTRLGQVVLNLLTNAAKYTEPGGRITIRAEADATQVILRIRDTGVGLSAEMLPRVFDLFVQERQTADRARGGLGLGLTLVRNLVSLHGGTVSAHSDGPGCGSEFVVRLPRAPAITKVGPARDATESLASPAVNRLRILVVDDNKDAAEMLAEALQMKGHSIRMAHDGDTALRLAEAFLPEVALLDIGLPIMDGYELAIRLRRHPALQQIRLLAVTGYGQESDRRRSAAAGFHQHLTKPIDLDVLEQVIQTVRVE